VANFVSLIRASQQEINRLYICIISVVKCVPT
jgi:hypothetical protein